MRISIEMDRPFSLHWGVDGWQNVQYQHAALGVFGLWAVDVTATALESHHRLDFTRRFDAAWEGVDHVVELTVPTS